MRDLITVIASTLGVLLVLAGATIIVLRALAAVPAKPAPATDEPATGSTMPSTISPPPTTTDSTTVLTPADRGPSPVITGASRFARAAWQLPEADRLIGWGIVLLIIAAISAGSVALSFSVQAGQ